MGSYLSQPVTEKHIDDGDNWGFSCMQGWRIDMEDDHVCIADLEGQLKGVGLFAVFDGHGGAEVARFCSKHLSSKVKEVLKTDDLPGTLTHVYECIDDMLRTPEFQAELATLRKSNSSPDESGVGGSKTEKLSMLQNSINDDLRDMRERNGGISREEATQVMMKMMYMRRLESTCDIAEDPATPATADNVGCTAVSALVTPETIVVANSGDSRAVLSRGGRAIPLSSDHKPNDDDERARIEAAGCRVEEVQGGARTHYRINGNLNLSRAIGDLEYKSRSDLPASAQAITCTPETRTEKIQDDDEFLILACDGIWDVMTDQQAVDFVREKLVGAAKLSQVCSDLLDACITPDPKETQGLGADNMTCIIVKLNKQVIE